MSSASVSSSSPRNGSRGPTGGFTRRLRSAMASANFSRRLINRHQLLPISPSAAIRPTHDTLGAASVPAAPRYSLDCPMWKAASQRGKSSNAAPIDFFHSDISERQTDDGKLFPFVSHGGGGPSFIKRGPRSERRHGSITR